MSVTEIFPSLPFSISQNMDYFYKTSPLNYFHCWKGFHQLHCKLYKFIILFFIIYYFEVHISILFFSDEKHSFL